MATVLLPQVNEQRVLLELSQEAAPVRAPNKGYDDLHSMMSIRERGMVFSVSTLWNGSLVLERQPHETFPWSEKIILKPDNTFEIHRRKPMSTQTQDIPVTLQAPEIGMQLRLIYEAMLEKKKTGGMDKAEERRSAEHLNAFFDQMQHHAFSWQSKMRSAVLPVANRAAGIDRS